MACGFWFRRRLHGILLTRRHERQELTLIFREWRYDNPEIVKLKFGYVEGNTILSFDCIEQGCVRQRRDGCEKKRKTLNYAHAILCYLSSFARSQLCRQRKCGKYDIICSNLISNRFTQFSFADISPDTCPISQIQEGNFINENTDRRRRKKYPGASAR
jgi:hypothetical protein